MCGLGLDLGFAFDCKRGPLATTSTSTSDLLVLCYINESPCHASESQWCLEQPALLYLESSDLMKTQFVAPISLASHLVSAAVLLAAAMKHPAEAECRDTERGASAMPRLQRAFLGQQKVRPCLGVGTVKLPKRRTRQAAWHAGECRETMVSPGPK